jgi:hypothetical protein
MENKRIEKVLPKNRINNVIRLIFNLIICIVFILLFSGFLPLMIIVGIITLFVLSSGLNNTSETLIISSEGFNYSNIFEKFEGAWKDILSIEVIEHKQRSEQTGLIVSSTMEYIFQTSNGTFTLKEDNAWGRDAFTLREVYGKIISRAPDAKIIQREEESILHDTGGK